MRAYGIRIFVTGGTPMAQDSSPITGISDDYCVYAMNEEMAKTRAQKDIEDRIGMTFEEAGLSVEVVDLVRIWHRLEEKNEDLDMVIDDLTQMVYHLGGRENCCEEIMDFLEHCNSRIGVIRRNYENPLMKAKIEGILEGDLE